jgi:hypothetical protein
MEVCMKYLIGLEVDEFNEIMNELGYYDNMIFDMGEIDEHFVSPYDALQSAYFGSFNPNDDYFTYNGYGNLETIHELDLPYYMEDYEGDIIELLESRGELEEYINLDDLEHPIKNETIKRYWIEMEEE